MDAQLEVQSKSVSQWEIDLSTSDRTGLPTDLPAAAEEAAAQEKFTALGGECHVLFNVLPDISSNGGLSEISFNFFEDARRMVVYANQQASLYCDRFNKIFPQFALPDSQSDLPLHIAEVSESGHHITFLMRTRNNPLLGAATVFFAGFIQSLTLQLRKIKQNVYIHSAVCSGNLLIIKHLLLDGDDNNSCPLPSPQLQGEPIEYAKLSSKISERLSLHEAILVTSSIANSAFAVKTKLIDHHKRAAQAPSTTTTDNNDASISFSPDFLKAMTVILFNQLSQSSSHISKTPGFEVTSDILPWAEPHIPRKTSFSGESYETADYFISPIDHCEGLSTVILTLSLVNLPLDIDNCIEVVKQIVKNTLAQLTTTLSNLAFRCENAEYDCFDSPSLVKLHFKCKAKSDLERRTALFVRCLYTNPNIPTIQLIRAITDFSAFFHIKQHESEITQRYKGLITSQQYLTERSTTSQSTFISNNYHSGQLMNAQNNWYSGDMQYKVMQYQSGTTDSGNQQYNSLEVAQKPQPRGFSLSSSDDSLVLIVKVLQRQLPMKLFKVGSPSSSDFPNEMIQLQVSIAVKEELQVLRGLLRCSPEQIPFEGTNNVMHRSLSSGKKDILWRPSSVFESLRDALLQLMKEATDSHAFLLRGSTGSGKSTLLQLLTSDIEGESFFSDENCAVFTRSMKEINYFNIAAAQSAVGSSRRSEQKQLISNGFASIIIEQSEYVISQVLPEWKEEVNARIAQSGSDLPASDIRMMKFEVEFRKKSVISLLTRFQRREGLVEEEEEDEIDYECDASLAVEMVVDYFQRFARKRIILLIDDIQHFDELSWRILVNLFTSSKQIFLVGTVRELQREDLVGNEVELVDRANDILEENVKGLFNSVVEIDSGEFSLSSQDKQKIVQENIARLLGGSSQEAIMVAQRQVDLLMRICERIQADRTPKDLVNAAFAFAARGLVDTKTKDKTRRLVVSKELSDVADNELVEYLHYADGDVRSHGICDVSVLINAVTGCSLQIMILLAVAGQQFDMRFITAVLANRLGVIEQVVEVVKQLCVEGALEVLVEGSLEFKWSGGGGQRLFGLKEKLLRCVSSRFVGETRKLLIQEVDLLFLGKMKHGVEMYVKAAMRQRFASVLARRHARRMKADNQKSEFLAGEVEASKAVAELAGRVARKATITVSGEAQKTIKIGEEETDLHGDCLFEVTVLMKQERRFQCKVHICIDEIVLCIVQSEPRMKAKDGSLDEEFVSVLEQFPYLDYPEVREIANNFQDSETAEIWVVKRTQLRGVTIIEGGETYARLALQADFARVYSKGGGVDRQQHVSELNENVSFELQFSEEKQGVAVLELLKCWEVPCEFIEGDGYDSGEEEPRISEEKEVEKEEMIKSQEETSPRNKQKNKQGSDVAAYNSQQQGDDEDMSDVQEELPSNVPTAGVAVDYSLLETGTFLSNEQLQMSVTDRGGGGVEVESGDIHRHLLVDIAMSDHVDLVLPKTNRGTSATFGTQEIIREPLRLTEEDVKKLLLPPLSFEPYNTLESNQREEEEEYDTSQKAVMEDISATIRSEQVAGYLKKDEMEKEDYQRELLQKKYEEVDKQSREVPAEVAQNDSKNQMEEHKGEVEDVPDFSEFDYNSGYQVQSLEDKIIRQIQQPKETQTTHLLQFQGEDQYRKPPVEVRNEKQQIEVRQLQYSAEVISGSLKQQIDDERIQQRVQQELRQQKQQEQQKIQQQQEQQRQYHHEQKQKQEHQQKQDHQQQQQAQLQQQGHQKIQQQQEQQRQYHQEQKQKQEHQQKQEQQQQQQAEQQHQEQQQQQQQQQRQQQLQQQQQHQEKQQQFQQEKQQQLLQQLQQKEQQTVDRQLKVSLKQEQRSIINQHSRQESESVLKIDDSTVERIAQPQVVTVDPLFASYNSTVNYANEIKKQVIVEEVSSSYLASLMSRFIHVPLDQQQDRQDNDIQIEGYFSNQQPSRNLTASELAMEEVQVESSSKSEFISVTSARESSYNESVIEEDERLVQEDESQVILTNKIVTPLANNSYLREPVKNAAAKRMEEQFAKRRDELRKIQLQRNQPSLQQNFHSPVKEFPPKEVVATAPKQFLKSPSTPSSAYSTTKRFQDISSDIPLISSVVRTACRSMRGDIFEVIPGDSVQLRLSPDPDEPSCEVIFNRKIGWFPSKRFFEISDQYEPSLPRSHAPTQPAFTYKFPERRK